MQVINICLLSSHKKIIFIQSMVLNTNKYRINEGVMELNEFIPGVLSDVIFYFINFGNWIDE